MARGSLQGGDPKRHSLGLWHFFLKSQCGDTSEVFSRTDPVMLTCGWFKQKATGSWTRCSQWNKMDNYAGRGAIIILKNKKITNMWECKFVQSLWKTIWRFLKEFKNKILHDPAIPLLHICPKELKSKSWTDSCTPMFIAVLFTIVKIWKHLNVCQQMNG